MESIKTLGEAKAAGYRVMFDSYARGYISRKTVINDDTPVMQGRGYRKGYLYYEGPCQKSTQYHFRVYLMKV